MKKVILIVAVMALMFGGCSSMTVQENVDAYKEARAKAIKSVKVVKCEKDCIQGCNTISNDIDRIDCKATCVVTCHE